MTSAIDFLPTISSCQAVSQINRATARWGPHAGNLVERFVWLNANPREVRAGVSPADPCEYRWPCRFAPIVAGQHFASGEVPRTLVADQSNRIGRHLLQQ